MFGSVLYGGGLYGGYIGTTASLGPSSSSLLANRVIFDGYSLDTTNIRIQDIDYDDVGDIEFETFDAPFTDGGGVLGHFYRKKDITIELTITGTDAEDLNTRFDEFKKRTRKTEGILAILVNGEYRIAEASVTELKFNREYFHITFCHTVVITFSTMRPHFRAEDNVSGTFTGVTGILNEDIVNTGTVNTECRLYFIFGAGNTGVTEVKVTLNGYDTVVTNTFGDGDVLIIDSISKVVTLNNSPVDYDGRLPVLNVDDNPIIFDITGTTVNADISFVFEKRYK